MKKTFRSIVCVLISVILSLSALATGIVPSLAYSEEIEAEPAAAVSTANGVSGSKSASPTELEKAQRKTEVTLTLPSAETGSKYDIVFVMDSSSSTSTAGDAFSVRVKSLLDSIVSENVTVKVGVVKFRGLAFDTIDLVSQHALSGLVEYSTETAEVIDQAIDVSEDDLIPEGSSTKSRGSNIHGGLKVAESILLPRQLTNC